jgi:hypothetical protein
MKKLFIYLLSFSFIVSSIGAKRPSISKPSIEKPNLFGQWLDKEGYVVDGPKIKNWVDSDGDRVDDRFQAGPGKPSGKKRLEVEKPKPRPKPIKPVRPTSDKEKPNKIEKPTRPARPELPDELKNQMNSYKLEKEKLREELKVVIKNLENPTRKKVKEAVDSFRKNNQQRFDNHKELAESIKENLNKNKPERPIKPVIPQEVKDLHKSHADKIKKLNESKKQFVNSLQEAKGEERKDLFDSFKEEQKALHDDLKDIQKQLRDHVSARKESSVADKARPERRPPPRPKKEVEKDGSRRPSSR